MGRLVLLVPPKNETRSNKPWGETLPPRGEFILRRVGANQCLAGQYAVEKALSCWRSSEPETKHLQFDPHGEMWHVNRRSFDKALLIQAAASGTEVLDRTSRLIASFEKEPCGWTVRFLCSEVQRTLSTTYLIDATGRSSLVGRRLGSKRALHDQLAAVWCIREYKGEILPLLVEAVPQGWWYSLAFPENMLLVALVTDPAAVNVSAVMRPRIWDLALQQAPYTKRRLGGDENRLTVTSVESARLNRMSGEGWIAIGDAAMSYDPLSSYGLGSAVEQAMEAAELLCSQNIEAELTKFEVKRSETYKEYQQQRNAFYESVLRFAESEFWRRRV